MIKSYDSDSDVIVIVIVIVILVEYAYEFIFILTRCCVFLASSSFSHKDPGIPSSTNITSFTVSKYLVIPCGYNYKILEFRIKGVATSYFCL